MQVLHISHFIFPYVRPCAYINPWMQTCTHVCMRMCMFTHHMGHRHTHTHAIWNQTGPPCSFRHRPCFFASPHWRLCGWWHVCGEAGVPTLSEHCWLQYESWESWWGFLQTNMGRYIGTLLSQLVLLESWFNWASRARWKGSGSDPDWHPSWFSWILVFTLRELSPF